MFYELKIQSVDLKKEEEEYEHELKVRGPRGAGAIFAGASFSAREEG